MYKEINKIPLHQYYRYKMQIILILGRTIPGVSDIKHYENIDKICSFQILFVTVSGISS